MPRYLSAEQLDFATIVRRDDTVLWGQGCGEALTLTQALLAQRQRIGAFSAFVGISFSETLQAEQADVVRFTGLGGTGACRRLTQVGALNVLPLHMTTVDALFRSGRLRADVVLVQVSPPDARGEYSLGLTSDYIRPAIDTARCVVAEVSDRVPFSLCEEPLHADDLDYVIETSRPPVEVAAVPPGEVERRIAEHVQPFIPQHATLQVGLGAIPDAVLASLRGYRGLGIHSAIIGDSVAELMAAGCITNEHKALDRGASIGCLLIGTRTLYDFAHRNSAIRMAPVTRTHGLNVCGRLDRFVALNSAVEVDLTGQVNAEAIGADYIGLVGGQVDFLRAAHMSEGGCPIVALPSTARSGRLSRIVATLSGPVTTARSDVGVVATEHGAADLRGLGLAERVRQMLALADPAHRESLERSAYELLRGGRYPREPTRRG